MKAIDISVYQRHPGRGWWRQVFSDGWELAIVGSWHGWSGNPYAEQNLGEAKETGFHVATYVFLSAVPGAEAVGRAQESCGAMWPELSFVAIDCEHEGIMTSTVADAVDAVEQAGLRPIIYTRKTWWETHFGNSTEFARLPLWTANYDEDATLGLAAPYGGWTLQSVVGKQYDGTYPGHACELYGVSVDKSMFDPDFVTKEDNVAAIDDLRRELDTLRTDTRTALAAVGRTGKSQNEDILNFMKAALTGLNERVKALEAR